MIPKQVKHLLPADVIDMGGIPVKQALPTHRVEQVDPFLLLHHAHAKYSNRKPAIQQGIGPHPHRGFSPVTLVIDGEVHHRDSRGHSQIAQKGEVQWMHAGLGIIHSERPSQAMVDRKGRMEIIQLWINSPADKKMDIPSYQHLSLNHMPVLISADHLIRSKLIAGSFRNQKGQIHPQSEVLVLWSTAQQGGQDVFDMPIGWESSMLYLVKGSISIAGYGMVSQEHLVVFDAADGHISITADQAAEFVILSGKPLGEKVTQHGPFVMNTQSEIMEAMRDYQMGKMGFLVEEA